MRIAIVPLFLLAITTSTASDGDPPFATDKRTTDREVCWSELPQPDGAMLNSEVISEFGFEIEVANDLVLDHATSIVLVRWWGGYIGHNPDDPPLEGFNLRFYSNEECLPVDLLFEIIVPHNCNETPIDDLLPPRFVYYADEDDGVCYPLSAGQRVWFSAQAADHPFPPQWARLAALSVTDCDTVFKSAYFSWPDWTPAEEGLGEPFDASQEFECGDCGGVPVETTSWGCVKALYR